MTMPDLGQERPGEPSDTRQMVERGRTETGGEMRNRTFAVALVVIVAVLVVVFFALR